jgi:hypothetical protein
MVVVVEEPGVLDAVLAWACSADGVLAFWGKLWLDADGVIGGPMTLGAGLA